MKESQDPNWPAARQKMNKLEKAVLDSGKKVDGEGNVTDEANTSPEDIQRMIADGVDAKFQTEKKDKVLSQLSSEDRALVEPIFEKLADVSPNLQENLSFAMKQAFPDRSPDDITQALSAGGSGNPHLNTDGGDKTNFADTDKGKAAATMLNIPTEVKEDNKSKE